MRHNRDQVTFIPKQSQLTFIPRQSQVTVTRYTQPESTHNESGERRDMDELAMRNKRKGNGKDKEVGWFTVSAFDSANSATFLTSCIG